MWAFCQTHKITQMSTSTLTRFVMHWHGCKYYGHASTFTWHGWKISNCRTYIKSPPSINNEQIYILLLHRVLNALKEVIPLFPDQSWLQAQVSWLEMLFYVLFMWIIRYIFLNSSSYFCLFGCSYSTLQSVWGRLWVCEWVSECVCVCHSSRIYVRCLRVCGVINNVSVKDT